MIRIPATSLKMSINTINNLSDNMIEFTELTKKNTSDSCANFSYISNINDKEYGRLFSISIKL